jgi:hypothetical protein
MGRRQYYFNLTNENLAVYNTSVALAQKELPALWALWIMTLITGICFTAVGVYILVKTRKVKDRNFFVFESTLLIVQAIAPIGLYWTFLEQGFIFGGLPYLQQQDLLCFANNQTLECQQLTADCDYVRFVRLIYHNI